VRPDRGDAARRCLRMDAMLIRISIEKTEPLVGTAVTGRGAPVPFVGWLDLLRAISEVVGADAHTREQCPDLAEPRIETTRGDRELS
jgi:hypothetical protein